VVAGEGDEVVVAGGLVSLEAAGHGEMVVQVWWCGLLVFPTHAQRAHMNGPPRFMGGPPVDSCFMGGIIAQRLKEAE